MTDVVKILELAKDETRRAFAVADLHQRLRVEASNITSATTGGYAELGAFNRIIDAVRQFDQEEPCPNPSTSASKPSGSTSPATSDTKPPGSHATSARTRTMQTTPATKPATPAPRRRNP